MALECKHKYNEVNRFLQVQFIVSRRIDCVMIFIAAVKRTNISSESPQERAFSWLSIVQESPIKEGK